ncbi:MAG TPA: hypothetical protein DEA92_06815, partial [Pseudomonas sp.]|nr:hypothetical protein [Pseudomonas sp.]
MARTHLETLAALLLPTLMGLMVGMDALGWRWLWLLALLLSLPLGVAWVGRRERSMTSAIDGLRLLLGDSRPAAATGAESIE